MFLDQIPHRTVNILLQRLAKEGHLRKAYGVYTIIKALPSISNSLDRVNAVRDIGSIAKNLMRFSSQDANRDITEDEATDNGVVTLQSIGDRGKDRNIDAVTAWLDLSTDRRSLLSLLLGVAIALISVGATTRMVEGRM